DTVATSTPLFRAGKVKILGLGSPERSMALPEMATIAEAGLPGFRSVTWFGLVAPPETPSSLAEKINRDVAQCLNKPEVVQKLRNLMLEPIGGTRSEGARFIADEAQLWARVIKQQAIEVK
ncbi:MAG TPA: tripartite tricarboxylate transporter substrate-binding protein, partial [Myxococcaceae bacterium]|nr:tripartite tricarboxylate transporter substrate-binding protein [Myxococcaceae bacterium]